MRQIKFRAWDKQHSVMLEMVTVYADADSIGLSLEEAEKHYTEEQIEGTDNHIYGGDDWIFVMNNFELMQFTGLLDKNGKEIYEGDIISSYHGKPLGAVEFVKGSFICDGWPLTFDIENPDTEAPTENWATVVGNIHETKPTTSI